MPFAKGNAGKPKGALTKTSKEAKEIIASVALSLGGAERLEAWIKLEEKNESAFWTTIYPKLLPLTVAGDKDNPLAHTVIERRIVHVNAKD